MDFGDTLSKGLTYTADSLTVKIGDATLVKDTAYTLTVGTYDATNGTSITVHLKDMVSRNYAKDNIMDFDCFWFYSKRSKSERFHQEYFHEKQKLRV